MPGKQMAIDADLNSGLIDEEEARRRRREVHAEADFYGAMDGASKFVKGDAIAAIVITLVNLLGGFGVGVAQKGMPFGDAVSTYSLLSIGDGLVSQIPALLLSVATGLIVTRTTGEDDMGSDIIRQITSHRTPLRVAGFAALALCLIPGLPKIPFILAGGIVLLASTRVIEESEVVGRDRPPTCWRCRRRTLPRCSPPRSRSTRSASSCPRTSSTWSTPAPAATCSTASRRCAARSPPTSASWCRRSAPATTSTCRCTPTRSSSSASRSPAARRPAGTVLAIGDFLGTLPGEPTREPVFGLEAKWIPAELRNQAELSGATVVDRASVITTHLAEVVDHARRPSARPRGRADAHRRHQAHPPRRGRGAHPHPAQLSARSSACSRPLLDEGVSVRDLVRIFEALSLRAASTKDVDALVDAARHALGPAIVAPYVSDDTVHVISLDPLLEQRMLEDLRPTEQGTVIALDPELGQSVLHQVSGLLTEAENANHRPVLVCSPQIRPALRRLLRPSLHQLPVLSYQELVGAATVRSVGVVSPDRMAVTA